MLQLLDAYVDAQLKRVTLNGESVTVLPYIPDREKGETVRPFYAFERPSFRRDKNRTHAVGDVWIPSAETYTLEFPAPLNMGGPEVMTGPKRWTKKPPPTMVVVHYLVHLESAIEEQARMMQEYLFQAFPLDRQPLIGDCHPLFLLGDMISADDRSKPLFAKVIPLDVQDVRVDRLEEETYRSIIGTVLDQDFV